MLSRGLGRKSSVSKQERPITDNSELIDLKKKRVESRMVGGTPNVGEKVQREIRTLRNKKMSEPRCGSRLGCVGGPVGIGRYERQG